MCRHLPITYHCSRTQAVVSRQIRVCSNVRDKLGAEKSASLQASDLFFLFWRYGVFHDDTIIHSLREFVNKKVKLFHSLGCFLKLPLCQLLIIQAKKHTAICMYYGWPILSVVLAIANPCFAAIRAFNRRPICTMQLPVAIPILGATCIFQRRLGYAMQLTIPITFSAPILQMAGDVLMRSAAS